MEVMERFMFRAMEHFKAIRLLLILHLECLPVFLAPSQKLLFSLQQNLKQGSIIEAIVVKQMPVLF
jgi:hypothetical protein